jgi:hypothetical protein
VSTFVDRGVSRGQHGGSPTVANLSVSEQDVEKNVKDELNETVHMGRNTTAQEIRKVSWKMEAQIINNNKWILKEWCGRV